MVVGLGITLATDTPQAHIADPASDTGSNNAAIDLILVALEKCGILSTS